MQVNVFKNCPAKTATFSVLQLGIHSNMNLCLVMQKQYRGSILGHNGDKNLKTFAPCYSQSTRWYNSLPYGFLGLEISTPTAESRWGLGFVYIISLFSLERSIVLSLITLYLYINTSFPHRNNNWKWGKERRKPNRKPFQLNEFVLSWIPSVLSRDAITAIFF